MLTSGLIKMTTNCGSDGTITASIVLLTKDSLGQPCPHWMVRRSVLVHVKHVALGVVTEQQLQGGHGGKVAGVLQEDDYHAIRTRVGDAVLCLLNREAAGQLAGSESWSHQQQHLATRLAE